MLCLPVTQWPTSLISKLYLQHRGIPRLLYSGAEKLWNSFTEIALTLRCPSNLQCDNTLLLLLLLCWELKGVGVSQLISLLGELRGGWVVIPALSCKRRRLHLLRRLSNAERDGVLLPRNLYPVRRLSSARSLHPLRRLSNAGREGILLVMKHWCDDRKAF